MKSLNRFLFVGVSVVANCAGAQSKTSPLAPLSFLIGKWQSESTPGIDVFRKDLGGHIIVRSAQSKCVGTSDQASSMRSVMTIYSDSDGKIRAIYFDNDGHVVRYRVAGMSPSMVQFVSDDADRGPHLRLTYSRTDDRTMAVKFEMAMPDHPSEFRSVAEANETRVTE